MFIRDGQTGQVIAAPARAPGATLNADLHAKQ